MGGEVEFTQESGEKSEKRARVVMQKQGFSSREENSN